MEDSLPIQESTYKALRTLRFYDKQWELTSFKDGGYAEFRENGRLPLSKVLRGIRLRDSVLTLVEFSAIPIKKPNRVSVGTMSEDEEKNGDWARLEVSSPYIEGVLQFFYDFPLRNMEHISEDNLRRMDYLNVCEGVANMLRRSLSYEDCVYENDGYSYYSHVPYDINTSPYVRLRFDWSRITLRASNFTLSFNPLRYSREELYKWVKAFRMALDITSKVSPSNRKDYPPVYSGA